MARGQAGPSRLKRAKLVESEVVEDESDAGDAHRQTEAEARYESAEAGEQQERSSEAADLRDLESGSAYYGSDRDISGEQSGASSAESGDDFDAEDEGSQYGETDYDDGIGDSAAFDVDGTDEQIDEELRSDAHIRLRDRRRENGEDSDYSPTLSEVEAEMDDWVNDPRFMGP
ncbi:hypothetical protein DFH07DRAFT_357710 [Mycena maculata]|uniref:Uncharacterized protein n=1 Tax=Mycena maculata TaxID=230809 RepID=A0AAD7JKH2_9AGAR|nr:hypothetical protein DFH07DRAFT_357710 [Mycena maculata]